MKLLEGNIRLFNDWRDFRPNLENSYNASENVMKTSKRPF